MTLSLFISAIVLLAYLIACYYGIINTYIRSLKATSKKWSVLMIMVSVITFICCTGFFAVILNPNITSQGFLAFCMGVPFGVALDCWLDKHFTAKFIHYLRVKLGKEN